MNAADRQTDSHVNHVCVHECVSEMAVNQAMFKVRPSTMAKAANRVRRAGRAHPQPLTAAEFKRALAAPPAMAAAKVCNARGDTCLCTSDHKPVTSAAIAVQIRRWCILKRGRHVSAVTDGKLVAGDAIRAVAADNRITVPTR